MLPLEKEVWIKHCRYSHLHRHICRTCRDSSGCVKKRLYTSLLEKASKEDLLKDVSYGFNSCFYAD